VKYANPYNTDIADAEAVLTHTHGRDILYLRGFGANIHLLVYPLILISNPGCPYEQSII
jgi:hypothetical protein